MIAYCALCKLEKEFTDTDVLVGFATPTHFVPEALLCSQCWNEDLHKLEEAKEDEQ